MPPITKIWLSTLKSKESIDPSEFTDLLCQILTHCSSYTNPDSNPKLPPMHALFRSVESPDNLLMITGYPSQDMNNEADRTYAEAFLPRMFEFVQHNWLKQLDLDVCSLPLGNDDLVLQIRDTPAGQGVDQVVGGWDVWPETEQGIRMKEAERGPIEMISSRWLKNLVMSAVAPPAPSERLELRMREQRRLRLLAKDGGEAVFNRKVVRAVTAELSFDCYWAEA
ncbi:hypothetical protein BDV36DRAFT_293990 [Aspergillus pseudocaelatus]|uniref:Uncharacterized protein n=1 Tax=Aspergillus pseudocaelatus TaxID=1825620 RepID=A0ABQ6WRJ8_9EURO|nr:hypothetical protein BDV36DRAFT_293990 [Aspergillus pseudocaelatus]